MSTADANSLIVQAQTLLTQALGALNDAPPPPPESSSIITTEAEFDAAYGKAATGDTLLLSSTFKYSKPLTLDKGITLRADNRPPAGRISKLETLPSFLNGMKVTGNVVSVQSVHVQHTDPTTDIVVMLGERLAFDRVRVLGDPVKGAKRGIAANGTDMSIIGCFIDDCIQPAQDTQAICSWDMGGGLTIRDCYLGGGAQSLMFGGSDSKSANRMPHDIIVSNCDLGKNKAWFGKAQIKCALELKAVRNLLVTGCTLEYAGTAMGQGAYLIVATVRNQGGKAPWSAIQNVYIQKCKGAHASGIINILGSDNNYPNATGAVDGLTLEDFTATDIDPTNITSGAGRLFMFDRAPKNVTLSNISVQGANLAALGYFSGAAPVGLKIERMALPTAKYGWKVDGGGMGRAALQKYAPDAVLDPSVI